MKLLKAPEPDGEQFVLMRVEMQPWITYYSMDGTSETSLGPVEIGEMIFFIRSESNTHE